MRRDCGLVGGLEGGRIARTPHPALPAAQTHPPLLPPRPPPPTRPCFRALHAAKSPCLCAAYAIWLSIFCSGGPRFPPLWEVSARSSYLVAKNCIDYRIPKSGPIHPPHFVWRGADRGYNGCVFTTHPHTRANKHPPRPNTPSPTNNARPPRPRPPPLPSVTGSRFGRRLAPP